MPFKNGTTLVGYGVVRCAPWDFVGLFTTEAEANKKALEMGEGYEVHYGEHQEGTDNFIWSGVGDVKLD
jgi:hypothetical protein